MDGVVEAVTGIEAIAIDTNIMTHGDNIRGTAALDSTDQPSTPTIRVENVGVGYQVAGVHDQL